MDVIQISPPASPATLAGSPATDGPEGPTPIPIPIPPGSDRLDCDVARQVARLLSDGGPRSTPGLRALVSDLTVRELRQWMARAEQVVGPEVSRELRGLAHNGTGRLPVYRVQPGNRGVVGPGQVELSWDHVRDKVVELARRLEGVSVAGPRVVETVFGPDDFPVVIGPGGCFATLMDGHHKLAGLMILSSMLERLGHETRLRNPLRFSRSIRASIERLPSLRQIRIPVRVIGQEKDCPPGAFVERLSDPTRYSPPIRLTDRRGRRWAAPPPRFSELSDNPFRKLATDFALKAKHKEDRLTWKGAAWPLWLKLPTAPDFVEFSIAAVMEAVFHERDEPYIPGQPVSRETRRALRQGLLRARRDPNHPVHDVLRQVPLVASESDAAAVGCRVKRVARGRPSKKAPLKLWPGDGEVQIWLPTGKA